MNGFLFSGFSFLEEGMLTKTICCVDMRQKIFPKIIKNINLNINIKKKNGKFFSFKPATKSTAMGVMVF